MLIWDTQYELCLPLSKEKKAPNLRDVVTFGVSVGNLYPLGFVVVTLGNDLFGRVNYYPSSSVV